MSHTILGCGIFYFFFYEWFSTQKNVFSCTVVLMNYIDGSIVFISVNCNKNDVLWVLKLCKMKHCILNIPRQRACVGWEGGRGEDEGERVCVTERERMILKWGRGNGRLRMREGEKDKREREGWEIERYDERRRGNERVNKNEKGREREIEWERERDREWERRGWGGSLFKQSTKTNDRLYYQQRQRVLLQTANARIEPRRYARIWDGGGEGGKDLFRGKGWLESW